GVVEVVVTVGVVVVDVDVVVGVGCVDVVVGLGCVVVVVGIAGHWQLSLHVPAPGQAEPGGSHCSPRAAVTILSPQRVSHRLPPWAQHVPQPRRNLVHAERLSRSAPFTRFRHARFSALVPEHALRAASAPFGASSRQEDLARLHPFWHAGAARRYALTARRAMQATRTPAKRGALAGMLRCTRGSSMAPPYC